MTQEEKLLARIKSLEDGLTTIRIFKKDGQIFCWIVEPTQKVEGEPKSENRV